MARHRRERPARVVLPAILREKTRPVAGISPWWHDVARELLMRPGLVGQEVTIEELTEGLPCYPDGRRPRPRAAARRLRHVLELVSRGPNGSRGKGFSVGAAHSPYGRAAFKS